ncbi:hypothetical protein [Rhodococcus koreensis]
MEVLGVVVVLGTVVLVVPAVYLLLRAVSAVELRRLGERTPSPGSAPDGSRSGNGKGVGA